MQNHATFPEPETKRGYDEKRNEMLEALAEKASQGNRIALYNLCDKLSGSIRYTTRYILGNEMDAEDVSQNVLLRICENIHDLRESKALRAWLGVMVIDESRRQITKNAKQGAILCIDDYLEETVEDSSAPLPGGQAEEMRIRNAVTEIVGRLPLRQREAVILHYCDDLAVADVADAMGVPQRRVSRYLYLAEKRLAAELEKRRLGSNAGASAVLSLGAVLSESFHAGAMEFVPANAGWTQGTLVQCQRSILENSRSAMGTGGKASAKVPFRAALVVVATFLLAAALVLWIVPSDLGAQNNVVQAAPAAGGKIIFSGGEAYSDAGRINPEHAEPWVEGQAGLKVLKWWVTLPERDAVLYEGNADEIGEVFSMLRDDGKYGEYHLVFRFEDKDGVVYRLSGDFIIQEAPEEETPEKLVASAA